MPIPKDLHRTITARYGTLLDLKANPELLDQIFGEMWQRAVSDSDASRASGGSSPFGISWMDSWVAHWVVHEKIQTAEARDAQFAAVLRGLVDLRFNARIAEIRRFLHHFPGGFFDPPPDGGTPEPGIPPGPEPPGPAPTPPEPTPPPPDPGPGPVIFFGPDAGPPEPGAPPAGPSIFEPPDGGPEPGTPPTGPDAGFMRDNPWIFYWFVSVRAPQILDMIDAHLTRRMNDVRGHAASD